MTRATATPRPGTCRTPTTSRPTTPTAGTWYDFFAGKAAANYGVTWGPGFATFQYPNDNRASTIWYHDHTLGMTRLNVYAGPAGFYIIRGGPAGDDAVLDTRFGMPAVLPGPAPKENDKFPSNKTYYEIPIAIQDRAFNADGSLFYPNTREFFDEHRRDRSSPETATSRRSGTRSSSATRSWSTATPGRSRPSSSAAIASASSTAASRASSSSTSTTSPDVEVWQIGNEGGFLAAPVNLTATNGNRLLMGLAERADVIVDFTNVPAGNYVLGNVGPDEPFKGFNPDGTLADGDEAAGIASGRSGVDRADHAVPRRSRRWPPTRPPRPCSCSCRPSRRCRRETVTRPLALIEKMGMGVDATAPGRRPARGAARHGGSRQHRSAHPPASGPNGCGWNP